MFKATDNMLIINIAFFLIGVDSNIIIVTVLVIIIVNLYITGVCTYKHNTIICWCGC